MIFWRSIFIFHFSIIKKRFTKYSTHILFNIKQNFNCWFRKYHWLLTSPVEWSPMYLPEMLRYLFETIEMALKAKVIYTTDDYMIEWMNFSCKHPPTTQITQSSARNVITLPNSVQNYCKTIQHSRAAAAGLASLMTKTSNDKTRQETSSRPGSQSSTWCLYAGRCEAAIRGQPILYSHCCSASGWEIIKFTTIFHVFSVFIN